MLAPPSPSSLGVVCATGVGALRGRLAVPTPVPTDDVRPLAVVAIPSRLRRRTPDPAAPRPPVPRAATAVWAILAFASAAGGIVPSVGATRVGRVGGATVVTLPGV